jgi:hypothetical protein
LNSNRSRSDWRTALSILSIALRACLTRLYGCREAAPIVGSAQGDQNLLQGWEGNMRLILACLLSLCTVCAAVVAVAQDFPGRWKDTTYNNPLYYSNRLPIDSCLYPAKQCGRPAADFFCKAMNAGGIKSWKLGRRDSGTYIQGSGDTCDLTKFNQCIAFTQIVCGYQRID